MSVLCRTRGDKRQNRLFVKGAPELLVSRCTKVREGKLVDLTVDKNEDGTGH